MGDHVTYKNVVCMRSGQPISFSNALNATAFARVYTITGSPDTMRLTLQGMKDNGDVAVIEDYTSTADSTAGGAITEAYDSFLLVPSWTGGTAVKVTVLMAFLGPGATFISGLTQGAVRQTVSVSAAAPGDFTVAHGLGSTPNGASIQVTGGGVIWFQATRYDSTNLYLVASDLGATAEIALF